jgi:multidrug resistance efflux pump
VSVHDFAKKVIPKLVTLTLVIVAVIAAYVLSNRYADRPWTRDGQVRAEIVKIAPRVMGYVVNVAVENNKFVRKGELLFEIDPRSFQLAVDKAQVAVDEARQEVAALEAAVQAAKAVVQQNEAAVTSAQSKIDEARSGIKSAEAATKESESGVISARAIIAQATFQLQEAEREEKRAQRLADQRAGSVETAQAKMAARQALEAQLDSAKAGLTQAQATIDKAKAAEGEAQAKLIISQNGATEAEAMLVTANAKLDEAKANLGERGDANVRIRSANVALEEAQLKLGWTSVFAPSDGYLTNVDVREGTFAFPGIPFAAFVDSTSFRVDGYFKETKLKHIQLGDTAMITLMSHPDRPIYGEVESIGFAINPPDIADTEGVSNLVPQIQPTFDWVRLAQRVPVRIRLKEIPENIQLVSGMTASISILPRVDDGRASP